jgi:hypothetical protein
VNATFLIDVVDGLVIRLEVQGCQCSTQAAWPLPVPVAVVRHCDSHSSPVTNHDCRAKIIVCSDLERLGLGFGDCWSRRRRQWQIRPTVAQAARPGGHCSTWPVTVTCDSWQGKMKRLGGLRAYTRKERVGKYATFLSGGSGACLEIVDAVGTREIDAYIGK